MSLTGVWQHTIKHSAVVWVHWYVFMGERGEPGKTLRCEVVPLAQQPHGVQCRGLRGRCFLGCCAPLRTVGRTPAGEVAAFLQPGGPPSLVRSDDADTGLTTKRPLTRTGQQHTRQSWQQLGTQSRRCTAPLNTALSLSHQVDWPRERRAIRVPSREPSRLTGRGMVQDQRQWVGHIHPCQVKPYR